MEIQCILRQKLNITFKSLSTWSRNTIGDIFVEVDKMEAKIKDLEQKFINDNSKSNRSLLNLKNA